MILYNNLSPKQRDHWFKIYWFFFIKLLRGHGCNVIYHQMSVGRSRDITHHTRNTRLAFVQCCFIQSIIVQSDLEKWVCGLCPCICIQVHVKPWIMQQMVVSLYLTLVSTYIVILRGGYIRMFHDINLLYFLHGDFLVKHTNIHSCSHVCGLQ